MVDTTVALLEALDHFTKAKAPKPSRLGDKEVTALSAPARHSKKWLDDYDARCLTRLILTPCLFGMVVLWLAAVMLTVWLDALPIPFSVPELVLTTLIASGSANVIGMFIIAARYLFPKGGELVPSHLSNPSSPLDSDE